jgi:predicted DNA-binding transcriptional regulator AlpA
MKTVELEGGEDTFLPTAKVKARYGGISSQWLWRHEKDESFPRATRINGRKFWRLSDLIRYENSLA